MSNPMIENNASVPRLMAAAEEIAFGLEDLCSVLDYELPDFEWVHVLVIRAADGVAKYRRDQGWEA